jgi:hypothetical protein
VFVRLMMMKSIRSDSHWKSLPKTHQWAEALIALPEVRDSVPANFKQKYADFLRGRNPAAAKELD